jgi:hypothetical protein
MIDIDNSLHKPTGSAGMKIKEVLPVPGGYSPVFSD